MARYQIAPTKTNLLTMKQQLKFTREGHELLEQKRDIILAELMGMMNTAKDVQEKSDTLLKKAYAFLEQAIMSQGKEVLDSLASTIPIKSYVDISSRKVMGLSLPDVEVTVTEKKPYYSFHNTGPEVDATIATFRELLDNLGKLAETRISVLRLAKEAQKTIRRVNALEKIYLPDYNESIQYIQNVLDEAERETFFTLKLIKKRQKNK